MTPETLSAIFDQYSQAKNSTSRDFGGSGLGLSISKKLLKLMDSNLEVTSEVGDGSIFFFEITLPIHDPFSGLDDRIIEGNDTKTRKIKQKVLLVDDSEFNFKVIDNLLKSLDKDCFYASSGEEALELLKRNTYDLILMDIHMTGINGYETVKQMQQRNDSTPVYTISGDVEDNESQDLDELQILGSFTKPIDPESFLKDVKSTLAKVKDHKKR